MQMAIVLARDPQVHAHFNDRNAEEPSTPKTPLGSLGIRSLCVSG